MDKKSMNNRLNRLGLSDEEASLAHKREDGLWHVTESRTHIFTSEELREYEAETGQRHLRIPILTELSMEELQALYQRIASRP